METKLAEKNLIFELIRFKNFDKDQIACLINQVNDFPWVLGQLLFNRVGGIAYYVLREADLLSQLNREFRNSLKNAYEVDILKTHAFKNVLEEFADIFSGDQFPYAILKGPFLISALYPEGLRTSNDVDILVNQKDTSACEELLKKHGFIQGLYKGKIIPATRRQIIYSRMNRGETVPFVKRRNVPWLEVAEADINFSLDYKAKNIRDIVSTLLKNTQPFEVEPGRTLFRLSDTDFLIHLCVHLYKEATVYSWVKMQRDLSLYKFCDIYAFLLEFGNPGFLRRLSDRILELNLSKECYYAFYYCSLVFPTLNHLDGFSLLLKSVRPSDLSYLKQIIDPGNDTVYSFNFSMINWLFCANRKSCLAEMTERSDKNDYEAS